MKLAFLTLFLTVNLLAQDISTGIFSRLGFGARAIAMGNAMSAVTEGDVTGYYNPAILPFSKKRKSSLTIGILSLDRNLDFLHYSQGLYPSAGFSLFLISSSIENIDLRDEDGQQIGNHTSKEYLFGFSFANKFAKNFSLGLTLKLYYNQLYSDIETRTFALDFGVLYLPLQNISIAISIQDLLAEYRWDSSTLYGEKGRVSNSKFPLRKTIGASYTIGDKFVFSADLVLIGGSQRKFNIGFEAKPLNLLTQIENFNLYVRAGVEYFNYPLVSGGVGIAKKVSGVSLLVDYTYKFERFAPFGMQFISIGIEI